MATIEHDARVATGPEAPLADLIGPEARAARARRPATGTDDAIVVDQLAKTYATGVDAVRGISFRVGRGEVYGILGPNGAGKSTTIGMLATLVRPTAGRIVIDGFDVVGQPREVRRRIGFAMQEMGIDEVATASEFLVLQGRLHGLSRSEASRRARSLLRLVDAEQAAGRRLGGASGGMRRRIDLASALIHLPPVLFLDEPTEGLDPRARAAMWTTIDQLNAELGMTVVLTTHYMDEADRLCDRVAIVDEGRIAVEGTPIELKASVRGPAQPSLEDVYLFYTGHAFATTSRHGRGDSAEQAP